MLEFLQFRRVAPPCRLTRVVVKRRRLVGHPFQKRRDFRVGLERCPGGETLRQLALAQRRTSFSMANPVHPNAAFAALAARHQVVFVDTRPKRQKPAAQGAFRISRRWWAWPSGPVPRSARLEHEQEAEPIRKGSLTRARQLQEPASSSGRAERRRTGRGVRARKRSPHGGAVAQHRARNDGSY